MQWNDSYQEQVSCFTTTSAARRRTHLTGLRAAMTRKLESYTKPTKSPRKPSPNHRRRYAEGLSWRLSVKVPEPKFSSQNEDKLVSSEVGPVVQGTRGRKAEEFSPERTNDARIICGRS